MDIATTTAPGWLHDLYCSWRELKLMCLFPYSINTGTVTVYWWYLEPMFLLCIAARIKAPLPYAKMWEHGEFLCSPLCGRRRSTCFFMQDARVARLTWYIFGLWAVALVETGHKPFIGGCVLRNPTRHHRPLLRMLISLSEASTDRKQVSIPSGEESQWIIEKLWEEKRFSPSKNSLMYSTSQEWNPPPSPHPQI